MAAAKQAMADESMEIDTPAASTSAPQEEEPSQVGGEEDEEEEDCSDLANLLDSISDQTPAAKIVM